MPRAARTLLPVALAAAAVALAGCGSGSAGASAESGGGSGSGGGVTVVVTATDSACDVATTTLAAGPTTFTVTNKGGRTNEFYVYKPDGSTVVGEVEDITPGLTRKLSVDLASGAYVYACKPGQSGDGIRGALTVS